MYINKEYLLSKTKIFVSILALSLLTAASWFGYNYFQEHYILLNQDDAVALLVEVNKLQQQAYMLGLQACNKTL